MEIDELIESADIARFIKALKILSKEWTKQDQLGSS